MLAWRECPGRQGAASCKGQQSRLACLPQQRLHRCFQSAICSGLLQTPGCADCCTTNCFSWQGVNSRSAFHCVTWQYRRIAWHDYGAREGVAGRASMSAMVVFVTMLLQPCKPGSCCRASFSSSAFGRFITLCRLWQVYIRAPVFRQPRLHAINTLCRSTDGRVSQHPDA